MAIKKLVNPATINTILNTTPLIIRGAGKLINLIKERKDEVPDGDSEDKTGTVTTDNLKETVNKLEARLDAADESNVEQIKLIEQLAKQNEMLASSLQRLLQRSTFVFILALVALLVAILGLAVE